MNKKEVKIYSQILVIDPFGPTTWQLCPHMLHESGKKSFAINKEEDLKLRVENYTTQEERQNATGYRKKGRRGKERGVPDSEQITETEKGGEVGDGYA